MDINQKRSKFKSAINKIIHTRTSKVLVIIGFSGIIAFSLVISFYPYIPSISVGTYGSALNVKVDGNYAYVSDYIGLAIFDVTDLDDVGEISYANLSAPVIETFVLDNYCYVANGESGLAIIDVTDPSNPGNPIYKKTWGYATGIYVYDNYAFLSYFTEYISGVAIINVSDPLNPGEPVHIYDIGQVQDLVADGNFLYTASGLEGVAVINISDPNKPELLYFLETDGWAQDLTKVGNNLYIADYINGLIIMDLTKSRYSPIISQHNLIHNPNSIFVYDEEIFMTIGQGGLVIFENTDGSTPKKPIYLDLGDVTSDIFIDNNSIYIATNRVGIEIFDSNNILHKIIMYNNTILFLAIGLLIFSLLAFFVILLYLLEWILVKWDDYREKLKSTEGFRNYFVCEAFQGSIRGIIISILIGLSIETLVIIIEAANYSTKLGIGYSFIEVIIYFGIIGLIIGLNLGSGIKGGLIQVLIGTTLGLIIGGIIAAQLSRGIEEIYESLDYFIHGLLTGSIIGALSAISIVSVKVFSNNNTITRGIFQDLQSIFTQISEKVQKAENESKFSRAFLLQFGFLQKMIRSLYIIKVRDSIPESENFMKIINAIKEKNDKFSNEFNELEDWQEIFEEIRNKKLVIETSVYNSFKTFYNMITSKIGKYV
ncbi:MAG: LVIVD repeat-containing protein [Promethearchaeota archaeon]